MDAPLLVVTTRSRLRSPLLFPRMLLASRRITRQLAVTEGVVRWASIVASPTEFWTVSAWRSRHAMQEFMRGGAHGLFMWQVTRWQRAFWLVRWRPGDAEVGDWDGVTLRQPASRTGDGEAIASRQDLSRTMPMLAAALDEDGRPAFASAPLVRHDRKQVSRSAGALVRVATAWWRLPAAVAALQGLRARLGAHPALVRAVVGIGSAHEALLLTLWADSAAAAAFVRDAGLGRLADRHPGTWALTCVPESEFGHWDGMRLRRLAATARP